MSERRKIPLGMKSIKEVLKEEKQKTGKLPPKILLDGKAYSKVLNSDNGHVFEGDKVKFIFGKENEEIVVRMYGSTYRIKSVRTKDITYLESEDYSPVIFIITG